MDESKIVILDWGMFSHTAITQYGNLKKTNSPYITSSANICMGSIFSNLRKIGLNKEDIVIIAKDTRSWRKQYIKEYKADRADNRAKFEADTGISFKEEFQKMDKALLALNSTHPFYLIQIEGMEADDISAVACTYFKNKQVICVSFDSDWEQFWHYDNVKIYSPHSSRTKSETQWKVKPKNFNVYKKINDEVKKRTHNNLSAGSGSKEEEATKILLIDMINLPDFVVEPISKEFGNIVPKEIVAEYITHPKLHNSFLQLYDKSKVIDYTKCINKQLKKQQRKSKKENV